jgi:nitrite reductase/ring-hydroxylating ferredoxin subunit
MASVLNSVESEKSDWQCLIAVSEVSQESVKMLRIAGRQIALFHTADGFKACDNRCPHEGYPLSEGSLSTDCVLTCNWHNWKFNLDTGDNLFGGDRLRTYPLEIRDGGIWIDLTEQPYAERYAHLRNSLHDAFDDYSYDRMARETARLIKIGADPLDVLRLAIDWSWQKLEFGWTHAYAGMADWLTLYHKHRNSRELSLVCLVESISHVAYDVLRERDYPFSDASSGDIDEFNEADFIDFIEAENEAAAVEAIRVGIRAGLKFSDFECALTQAALLHYNDFGHSLIYVTKAAVLIEQLKWGKHKSIAADPSSWRQRGISKSLQATVACSGNPPEQIYRALLIANAVNLLSFDINQQDKIKVPVSGNVGWLDFTHGITFANAVRLQCTRYPQLWPQGLMQMACFNGRNAAFTTPETDVERWCPGDPHEQLQGLLERVLDHGEAEHIVSVHLLKTALAVGEEIATLETADARLLVAALTRFFDSPLKRRQARRTAHQSLQFVARE